MQLERTASRVSLLEVKRRIVRVQPTCRWTFIDLIRLRDACMLEYFLETIYHLGRSWRAPGLLAAIVSTQKQPTSLRSHKNAGENVPFQPKITGEHDYSHFSFLFLFFFYRKPVVSRFADRRSISRS